MVKRGEMTFGQIAKLILAVAVVVLLLFLLARLFVPMFDREDETAKSYLKTLEEQIKVADNGGVGEFFMWDLGTSDKIFYLVYFGEAIKVDYVNQEALYAPLSSPDAPRPVPILFSSLSKNSNRICVCYVEGGDSICRSCKNFDHPSDFFDTYTGIGFTSAYESGYRIDIKMEGDRYVFTEAK